MRVSLTKSIGRCLWASLVLLTGVSVQAELRVRPTVLEFAEAYARAQLLVNEGATDLTRSVTYQNVTPQIVTVDATGLVTPRGEGAGRILVLRGTEQVVVPVNVTQFELTRRIDFATEVEPLLTRYSCNSGGCHGKASGQNGFKLSLFGFSAEFDYAAIVTDSHGRRVFSPAPAASLMLQKATASIPHGGGKRFDIDSEPYRILSAWIESGAPASAPDVPTVTKLEVFPTETLLTRAAADAKNSRNVPGTQQQLVVTAVFSDGRRKDVTRRADFASNLDVVAAVDETGLVRTTGLTGEAAIMTRYQGRVAVFRAVVPHGPVLTEIPGFTPINEIDRLAVEKWKRLGLLPSPVCDDATFLRRATLDVCGRLPTVEEVRQFLSDTAGDKRSKLIDRLLDSPEYAAFFAMRWGVILRNSNLAGAERAAYAFHNWIRDQLARNRPYDEFVRGIVAASGEWQDAPAINWFWQARDDQLHMTTADTAQLFLGIRLQCARCHHHPYERWGQEDYFGLAGFFTRLGRKSFGEPPPYFTSGQVSLGEPSPLTKQSPLPKYPDGDSPKFTAEEDPRHALVDWMAKPDNPLFAKAFVNRMWGHCFGRGLVNEVDDMRDTNPPSNPEILDSLARDFVDHKFDMKQTLRVILQSRMYQLSAEPRAENQADRQNFARFYARRMIAEVFLDSVDQACGTKSNFGNMAAGSHAIELPHEGFGSTFLDTFDRPKRVTVCECERSAGATLAQVLLLANSDDIENKIADANGRVTLRVNAKTPLPELVEELFLATVSRPPTADERTAALGHLETTEAVKDLPRAVQDLMWSLLNSKEFMFQH